MLSQRRRERNYTLVAVYTCTCSAESWDQKKLRGKARAYRGRDRWESILSAVRSARNAEAKKWLGESACKKFPPRLFSSLGRKIIENDQCVARIIAGTVRRPTMPRTPYRFGVPFSSGDPFPATSIYCTRVIESDPHLYAGKKSKQIVGGLTQSAELKQKKIRTSFSYIKCFTTLSLAKFGVK